MSPQGPQYRSPVTALVLGWVIPGAGHAYAGRWGKAVLFAVLIIGLLVAGFVLGGGSNIQPNEWWFGAQLGAGGPLLALTPISQYLMVHGEPDYANPVREMGTLYTAVAGLLNLLVMMDAYVQLAYPNVEESGDGRGESRATPERAREGA